MEQKWNTVEGAAHGTVNCREGNQCYNRNNFPVILLITMSGEACQAGYRFAKLFRSKEVV